MRKLFRIFHSVLKDLKLLRSFTFLFSCVLCYSVGIIKVVTRGSVLKTDFWIILFIIFVIVFLESEFIKMGKS